METIKYSKDDVLRNISLQICESFETLNDYGREMTSLVNRVTNHFGAGASDSASISFAQMSLVFSKMENVCSCLNFMRRDYQSILKSSDIMVELPQWFDIRDFRPLSES